MIKLLSVIAQPTKITVPANAMLKYVKQLQEVFQQTQSPAKGVKMQPVKQVKSQNQMLQYFRTTNHSEIFNNKLYHKQLVRIATLKEAKMWVVHAICCIR